MPYLHCLQCRLTVHTGGGSSPESCPRCEAALDNAPRSMFALRPPQDHRDSYGRHRFVRSTLVSTGLFRDRTQASGDRAVPGA